MSKRTLRRAAERQAHKADRPQQVTAHSTMTAPTNAFIPNLADFTDLEDDPNLTPEVREILERVNPGYLQQQAEIDATTKRLMTRTASQAQIAANRENAKLSTGPITPQGRATVSENRRTHGLAGRFTVLPWEDAEGFQSLAQSIREEHSAETGTEQRLVESLIQHYWLKERAIQLQEQLIASSADPTEVDSKKLSLFLRYQTTHERSYYKAERELKNIQKEKRKERIGFESQNRRQESQEAQVRLANARARSLEIDTDCRQVMEVPLPGNAKLSFEEIAHACSTGIATAVYQNQSKSEAAVTNR